MADSVNISWNWTVAKDSGNNQTQHSFSYTPASSFKGKGIPQSIPTSITLITFPNAASIAAWSCRNLDLTNYVEIFTDSTGTTPFCHLLPGESMPPLRVKAAVPYYAKANTATVKIELDFDGAS